MHLLHCTQASHDSMQQLKFMGKAREKKITIDVQETEAHDTYEDDTPIRLSQMIRSMFIDVNNESVDSNNEEKDNITVADKSPHPLLLLLSIMIKRKCFYYKEAKTILITNVI